VDSRWSPVEAGLLELRRSWGETDGQLARLGLFVRMDELADL
jgi:hypothetical protein